MKKIKLKKNTIKFIIAFIMAVASIVVLYNLIVPEDVQNLEFEQYVKASKSIKVDEIITEDMLEYAELPKDSIPAGIIKSKTEVIGKYSTTNILKDEALRTEKVKKEMDSKYTSEEREVRIYTNVQAYGGVGPGDQADLIYTGNALNNERIGILQHEGVLVKKVLNESGIDIQAINSDKYSQNSTIPRIVVLTVSQEMALEIETLQDESQVNFKLIKWTERSKEQNKEKLKMHKNEIINRDASNDSGPVVKEDN